MKKFEDIKKVNNKSIRQTNKDQNRNKPNFKNEATISLLCWDQRLASRTEYYPQR